jgi:hypothetical protein
MCFNTSGTEIIAWCISAKVGEHSEMFSIVNRQENV